MILEFNAARNETFNDLCKNDLSVIISELYTDIKIMWTTFLSPHIYHNDFLNFWNHGVFVSEEADSGLN